MNRELKEMIEKRNAKIEEMKGIVNKVSTEKRSLTTDEESAYNTLKSEVEQMDKTIAVLQDAENRQLTNTSTDEGSKEEKRAMSEVLADYIRGKELSVEERAAMTTTSDGVAIPVELSKDIIKDVKESSDLISDISIINSKGTYKQIIETEKPTAGWTDELAAVTESKGHFDVLEIGHHKLGGVVKVSYELINENDFDILGYIHEALVESFGEKLEEAIFSGTGEKQPEGIIKASDVTTYALASANAITPEELIAIKNSVKARYRKNSVWRMHSTTLTAIEKMKDGAGHYIFVPDATDEFAGRLFGYPVKTTDAAPEMGTGACPIIFGNVKKAYKGNLNPGMLLQVLREKYAEQGAIGVLGFLFFDGKVVNKKAVVVAKCPEA